MGSSTRRTGDEPRFLVLRTTGPDPARDRVVGWSASEPAGASLGCPAFSGDLAALEAWADATAGATLVVPDGRAFEAFAPGLDDGPGERRWIGLDELRAWLLAPPPAEPPATPGALRRALIEAVRHLRMRGPSATDWLVRGHAALETRWRASDERAAAWGARVLATLAWAAEADESGPAEPWPDVPAGDAALDELVDLAHERTPRWTERLPTGDPFPPRLTDPTPFPDDDYATLDRVFEHELPHVFGDPDTGHRAGQHELARAVARNLAFEELLVVHAPTGTGKTLGYLVPAALWAWRNGVRVGVSTYTRALQEQAMKSDVPALRAALERCGAPAARARIHALKGRSNYLCWRSLLSIAPLESHDPEPWLAWTRLVAFALVDVDGDLDRFDVRPPLGPLATPRFQRELAQLVRQVRAGGGCCHATRDRRRCAAEVARHRAERSHVVVTNHSFVLARPEFFHHLVFDECEHLHDQAASAWSSSVTCGDVRRALERLREPSHPMAKAPLNRLVDVDVGPALADDLEAALDAWQAAAFAVGELEREIDAFVRWRKAQHGIVPREQFLTFVRYVSEGPAAQLVDARVELVHALSDLDAALVGLHAQLEMSRLKGRARLQRALELGRSELTELGEAVAAWLPILEGRPHFDPTRLYDVEEERKTRRLVARILCPNEHLGRHYYPELASGAFVSATTWLRGGFECALGYLGLDRTRSPAEDENREPRAVETLRAPSPFDYARALVCVPTDAPDWSRDKDAFHEWVFDFLARLGRSTRGRLLALFTNASDVRRAGARLAPFFRRHSIPFWYQGMPGTGKEDLPRRFRERDSVLCGVDTFWFGADFAGRALEYLVIVRLPYGPPDRYHHAQAALLGSDAQRRRIYMPRALAKFRQGFGRLMRRVEDKGVVFVLDNRILAGRHQVFLRELPIRAGELEDPDREWEEGGAELVRAPTDECFQRAFEHMELEVDDADGSNTAVIDAVPDDEWTRPEELPF